ncbi:Hsp20 family protein [Bdellovibrionota bacterium FG-1]
MALPPIGSPSHATQKGRSSAALNSPEDRAYEAEREANRRIATASQGVDEAQRVASERIDSMRDRYEKHEEEETTRQSDLLEKQRNKGYEELREMQRVQQADLNRTRREGERELEKSKTYYRDTLANITRDGSQKTREIDARSNSEVEYKTRTQQDETKAREAQYQRRTEEMKGMQDVKIKAIQAASQDEYQKAKGNTLESNQKAEETFHRQYEGQVAEHDKTLQDLDQRASRAIREVRQDYTRKLSAYETRQKDPFYRMLSLDARMEENADEYILTATIPIHEQKNVSVAVKGNQLVMTGNRRSEEKLELEPGRQQGTSSYQSFLETFPIAWPVDANKMSREFDGEQLTVRVPKKAGNPYKSPVKEKPSRVRVERPKFPENIPLAKIEEPK